MDEVTIAMQIAERAHHEQKDKVGDDYIKHPIAVSSYCKTERGKIAALLHDVVEDSDTTLKDLRTAGIGEDVIMAVKCLTKIKNEKLEDYYNRIALNDIATEVKFADMRHNSERSRFPKGMKDEAEKNYLKYYGRAKQLSQLAGTERAKALMTDETYAWRMGSQNAKIKRTSRHERNVDTALKDVLSKNSGDKKIKVEGYYLSEYDGELKYARLFTDGSAEHIGRNKETGMFIVSCYPSNMIYKEITFLKDFREDLEKNLK